MKTLSFLLAGLSFVFLTHAASPQYHVKIDGMTCSSCSNMIQSELSKLPEVAKVKVFLKTNVAVVTLKDGKKLEESQVKKALKAAGPQYRLASVEVLGKP